MTDQPSYRTPLGIPISRSVQIPAGRAFDPVRIALEAIDSVHGDGMLPSLPVIRTRGRIQVGAYEWNSRTGEALRLSFSVTSDHPELSVVHEIGHFLDHQAFGRPGIFASDAADVFPVMHAIEQSAASDALRSLRGRRRSLIWERGRRIEVQVQPSLVEYLLCHASSSLAPIHSTSRSDLRIRSSCPDDRTAPDPSGDRVSCSMGRR